MVGFSNRAWHVRKKFGNLWENIIMKFEDSVTGLRLMVSKFFHQHFSRSSQQSLNSDNSEANPLKLPWFISLTCVLTFYGLDIVRLFIYSSFFCERHLIKWNEPLTLLIFVPLLIVAVRFDSFLIWNSWSLIYDWCHITNTSQQFALWSALTLIALNSFTYGATIAARVFQPPSMSKRSSD